MEPFIADGKYSDAQILNRMLNTNAEGVVDWLNENDIFILFWTKRGDSTNSSRLVTKLTSHSLPLLLYMS